MFELDKKDFQILSLLDWNARLPITQLAKKIGINKDVARYRIKNLEDKGIISGYYSLIDMAKLGYLTFRGYISLINSDEKTEQDLLKYLDKKFNAGTIFLRDGEFQIGFLSWEKSIYEFQVKLNNLKKEFGVFFEKIEFTIFTEFSHYSLNDFNKQHAKEVTLKEGEVVNLKEDDLAILGELSENAKISSLELSKKLDIPQTTIIYKIKELEKKQIIRAYRAEINYLNLGYENYFLEIYTNDGQDIRKIKNYSKTDKNVVYSVLGIFGSDIELECEFKNKKELVLFMNKLKKEFKSIKKIKYCSTLKYYKLKYFPK